MKLYNLLKIIKFKIKIISEFILQIKILQIYKFNQLNINLLKNFLWKSLLTVSFIKRFLGYLSFLA